VVEVGEREAHDWKVHRETAPVMRKAPRDERRRSYKASQRRIFERKKKEEQGTQRERGVPSSANWNPTNPLTRRHQQVAVASPHCTATK